MTHTDGAGDGNVLLLETGQQLRVVRLGAFQHLIAGVTLALAGFHSVRSPEEEHRGLGWFALVAGAVLIVAVIRELREKHHPIHSTLGWVDLIAVPSILVEAWHRSLGAGRHRISLAYVLLALITLLRGVYVPRLLRLRRAEVDERHLFLQIRLWRRLRLAWDEIERIETTAEGFLFRLLDGKAKAFPLTDVRNRTAAEAFVLRHWERVRAARVTPPVAAAPDASQTTS